MLSREGWLDVSNSKLHKGATFRRFVRHEGFHVSICLSEAADLRSVEFRFDLRNVLCIRATDDAERPGGVEMFLPAGKKPRRLTVMIPDEEGNEEWFRLWCSAVDFWNVDTGLRNHRDPSLVLSMDNTCWSQQAVRSASPRKRISEVIAPLRRPPVVLSPRRAHELHQDPVLSPVSLASLRPSYQLSDYSSDAEWLSSLGMLQPRLGYDCDGMDATAGTQRDGRLLPLPSSEDVNQAPKHEEHRRDDAIYFKGEEDKLPRFSNEEGLNQAPCSEVYRTDDASGAEQEREMPLLISADEEVTQAPHYEYHRRDPASGAQRKRDILLPFKLAEENVDEDARSKELKRDDASGAGREEDNLPLSLNEEKINQAPCSEEHRMDDEEGDMPLLASAEKEVNQAPWHEELMKDDALLADREGDNLTPRPDELRRDSLSGAQRQEGILPLTPAEEEVNQAPCFEELKKDDTSRSELKDGTHPLSSAEDIKESLILPIDSATRTTSRVKSTPSHQAHTLLTRTFQFEIPKKSGETAKSGTMVVGLSTGGFARVHMPEGVVAGQRLTFNLTQEARTPITIAERVGSGGVTGQRFEARIPMIPEDTATLRVMTPCGVEVEVPLPPGFVPGQSIAFNASVSPTQRRTPCAMAKMVPRDPSMFGVCVPANVHPNQKFKAVLPTGEAVFVTVPKGAISGVALSFRSPLSDSLTNVPMQSAISLGRKPRPMF